MPIYTYRCESCGIQFELQQGFNDRHLLRCPECGKRSLRKVYLPVGILFKGSGFYATDHRSPSGQGTSIEKKKESSSEVKTAPASDPKPEEKEK